jgi:1,4-dihydroxy-2-naphthoyl-CoA hydrolase
MELQAMVDAMPFASGLGIVLDQADVEEVRGSLTWDESRCTTGGILHGGALMSLTDSIGALCAFLNLPEGAITSTIESKTNFFRGVSTGRVVATAKPLHVGRRTIAVQTEVRDDAGKLVALTTQTQAVIS